MTVAVTLFALLELYKRGEATWEQDEPFGADHGRAPTRRPARRAHEPLARSSRRCCSSRPTRSRSTELADALQAGEEAVARGARRELRDGAATAAASCCARSPAAGRSPRTRTPRRPRGACSPRPRTPPLTPAQAETLAIVAYLQPVSRPEIARIRGVASESATAALVERGLIEEAGRSQFGAVLYRTTPLFLKLFGLRSLDELPDARAVGPDARRSEAALRERLLRAGRGARRRTGAP